MMCSRVRIRRMDMDMRMRMRGTVGGAVGRRGVPVLVPVLEVVAVGSRGLAGLGGSCRR